MDNAQIKQKIRQQFDFGPYPRIPVDKSPKEDANELFVHNLVTPYYLRNQKVVSTEGKLILDAGCGTGYKSLVLAEANPGARIVGIDLSAESVKLAKQRLQYHGFENAEFYELAIEELPSLGLEFDYINCDELLYLFPKPAMGLEAMKSVSQPDGIIRANLHSALQRSAYYRAQEVFKMMGLFDANPEELEIGLVQEVMKALKNNVNLKATAWHPDLEKEDAKEAILMNFLFQGDKGSTIPEMFAAIAEAGLEFVSMVNWRHWGLLDLFNSPDNLPAFLGLSLPEVSVEEELRLFELIHPVHRLLDFWCACPNPKPAVLPAAEWEPADWARVRVYLHPQLRTLKVKESFIASLKEQQPLDLATHLSFPANRSVFVDTLTIACLLPLMEKPQPFVTLVDRWLLLRPTEPLTLQPVTLKEASEQLKEVLMRLETFLYVLLEISALPEYR